MKSALITALVAVLAIGALIACDKDFNAGNYTTISDCLAASSNGPGGSDTWKPADQDARAALCQTQFAAASPSPSQPTLQQSASVRSASVKSSGGRK
jgi:uncharacterized protein YgiB involved in biofilm formation